MWHGRVIASLLAARGVGEHSRVLDCTCGIGTQALPLAVLGYNVTGTDLSQRSVERARMEARARGLQIDLEVADVRTVRKVIALHGPSGERQGAGQAWVWSPAGDQLQIALFTLAEGPNGVWNAAAHETTLRALRRSVLTAALAQHGFEAVHWPMPEESGYYQPIVVAVAESQDIAAKASSTV